MIKVSVSLLSYKAKPFLVLALKTWLVIRASSSFVVLSLILAGGVVMSAQWRRRTALKFSERNPEMCVVVQPNGRFEVGKKICLSISGHHPETWQPSWSSTYL